MNEAYENCYLELGSCKTETEPTIYDDVVAEGSTPVVEHTSYETCSLQAVKKMQTSAELDNSCQRDVVFLRRMLFFMSAVAVVALLTAAAALFLAITAMKASGTTSAVKSEDRDRLEKEFHLKKIQGLEDLLNVTREDIKEMSRNHATELSLAQNNTRTEFQGIWCAINSLKQVEVNLTEQINNISKMPGPFGPPGFNGSQDAAGSKGAANLSSCQYKKEGKGFTVGNKHITVGKIEPTDKIILGATCSTNYAKEYNLLSQHKSGKWMYACRCEGDSDYFKPKPGINKQCFIHYWECPLAT